MKSRAKRFLAILSSVILALVAVLAVACNEPLIPPSPSPYWYVSAEYDETQGTVTLSKTKVERNEEGEEVTATVTANEGYEVDVVTVNDAEVTLTDGQYTFTVTQDTVVKATFRPDADLPGPSITFGIVFRASWISVDGEMSLTIGTNTLVFGDTNIQSVTASGSGSEQSYSFTADGANYSLSWLNFSYAQGYVLHLLNNTAGTSAYFVKSSRPAVEISEHFEGNWILEHGKTTLVIENNRIVYDGKEATAIVDLGYYESSKDSEPAPIKSNMYYFFVEGRAYLLGWYPDGSNPTVNAYSYIEDIERVYTFSEWFQGSWVSLDQNTTVVIDELSFAINGTTYEVDGYNEYMFIVEWEGLEYEVQIYLGSDYVLQFTHNTYDENNIITGSTHVYFVNAELPEVSVDPEMYGTWKASASSVDALTIDENGIYWGSDQVVVIAAGEARSDGYVYTVAVRNCIYTLFYLDQWAGYDDEAEIPEDLPQWLFVLDGSDGYYEFAIND